MLLFCLHDRLSSTPYLCDGMYDAVCLAGVIEGISSQAAAESSPQTSSVSTQICDNLQQAVLRLTQPTPTTNND